MFYETQELETFSLKKEVKIFEFLERKHGDEEAELEEGPMDQRAIIYDSD